MTLSRARPVIWPLAETGQEKPSENGSNGSFPIPGGAGHRPLGEVESSDWFGQFRLYPGGLDPHASGSGFIPHRTGLAELVLKEGEGWLWTKKIPAYLWRNNSGSWLYYFGEQQGPLFGMQSRTLIVGR